MTAMPSQPPPDSAAALTNVEIAMLGNFDGVSPEGVVSGWCWSPDEPDVRRGIIVFVDGAEIGGIVADAVRADLVEAGVGDGAHAFHQTMPHFAPAPGRVSVVVLRDAATGRQIGGDVEVLWPEAITAAAAMPAEQVPAPASMQGTLDRVTRDGWVSGWCWYPADPDQRIDLDVLVDDEVVGVTRAAAFRSDLQQAGIGDGAYAFSFALPWSVMGSKGHMTIAVRDGATFQQLGEAITLRLGRQAAAEDRIQDLERQVRLLRGHIEELTGQARARDDDRAARALFRTVGAFFQELAETPPAGGTLGLDAGLRGAVADIVARHPALTLAHAPDPLATICIDAVAPLDQLYRCLAMLQAHGADQLADIVVLDDGGHGAEPALLPVVVRNLRYVRLPAGTTMLDGRNRIAAEARGAAIVFMAPEIEAEAGWLPALMDCFARESEAVAIGAAVLRDDGTIQHAGLVGGADGMLHAAGRAEPADHPQHGFMRRVHALGDLAVAIRLSAFRASGGFSLRYRTGMAASVDLCFRLRAAGGAVLVQPAARALWIDHRGRMAPEWPVADDDARLLASVWLRPGWLGAADDVAPVGHALVIDTEMPRPDHDAGSVATLEQMVVLRRLGWRVTFAPADGAVPDPARVAMLEAHGIEVARPPAHLSVTHYLEQHGSLLDLVQVYRHATATLFLDRIRALAPAARLVFSPADLHHLREAREAALNGRQADAEIARTRAAELACVAAFDATILPSDAERHLLAQHVAAEKLHLLRWITRNRPDPAPFAQRSGACFVGNFNHGPNTDAVLWFVRDILKLVRAELPDFRFHIAGSHMPAEISALADDASAGGAVVVHGWVPALAPLFAATRLSVAPLRYGAGFKGKVAESLSFGVPGVATPIAAEGTGLADGDGLLVADGAAAFAAAVVRVHQDAALWQELSARGLERCAALYSPEAALEVYRAMLAGLELPVRLNT